MAQTLREHLVQLKVEEGLSSIFLDMAKASKRIRDIISLREMVKGGETNATGDVQSSLDVKSQKIIAETVDQNEHVCAHLSEECEELRTCKASGTYFVSYDPYDGGSVGDANITVGSIFGVWSHPPVVGDTAGKNLVAAAYSLWGPGLVFAFGTKEHGIFWYEYDGTDFMLIGPLNFDVGNQHTSVFGPSDITSMQHSPSYQALFNYMLASKVRLRYAGAMVTDTHHILMRGGAFWYPSSKKKPEGHLRLMYECAPLGLLVQIAGGQAVNSKGVDILDTVIEDWHQRTPIMFVSPAYAEEAVRLFIEIGKEVN